MFRILDFRHYFKEYCGSLTHNVITYHCFRIFTNQSQLTASHQLPSTPKNFPIKAKVQMHFLEE
jgi:hypothetical protein